MSRVNFAVGALLLALGFAVFGVKVFVYGLPVLPADVEGLWRVELEITVRGEGSRGSVSALLPASEVGQIIFDERSSSDRLEFSIRTSEGQRVGVWRGFLEDVHEIHYEFRVESFPVNVSLPTQKVPAPPAEVRKSWTAATSSLPSSMPEIEAMLEQLALPPREDVPGRVRTLYAFVTHEIADVDTGADDALLTLLQRAGTPLGKERLLATLLRAAGIPARNVRGLALREQGTPQERIWTQAWLDGRWVPMSSVYDFFGTRPAELILMGDAERALVQGTGVRAVAWRYRALRERLHPEEIATVMSPGNRVLAALSLWRLPLPSQSALRVLLLLPLGALAVAVFRNLIGVPTYGTFMPVLICLALRHYDLFLGLLVVAVVLVIGVLGRFLLDRLRLLLVPRLGILLCLVVLTVTAAALLGRGSEMREFFAGALLPMVILTMLIERFSITTAEEGLRQALLRALGSVVVATAIYPFFQSVRLSHVMFSYPELVVSVMGILIWIGSWTGYRVTDWIRFRALARRPA